MRALIVAEQLRRRVPGGIGTYVRGLAQGLGALDTGVVEATWWASRRPAGGSAPDPVAALGPMKASRLPGPLLTRAWDRGLAGCPAGFDVMHATSLAVPPGRGTLTTVFVHDLAWRRVPEAYPQRGRRWHEAALGRALRRARAFLVPSRDTADDLVAAGAPAARVEVVAEGSDHLPVPDTEGARKLLSEVGIDGDYLLSVSTVEPRKNLARLLAAYRGARPRLPEPWPLLVVGPAGWGAGLVPEPGAVVSGPVEAAVLAALYQGARLVAYVPLAEGFGLPALEAMACATPVVASPLPSTNGAAFEVDPRAVAEMADAIVTVAGDEGTRSRLVTAGLLRAGELTWAAAARRHVEIWEGVLAGATP